jgi:hypothetical protein
VRSTRARGALGGAGRATGATLLAVALASSPAVGASPALERAAHGCVRTVAQGLAACVAAVGSATRRCIARTGATCAASDLRVIAALDRLTSRVRAYCRGAETVRAAGYGAALTPDGLVERVREACRGAPETLAARTFGGPHAALLAGAAPEASGCMTSAQLAGERLVVRALRARSACLLGARCDPRHASRAVESAKHQAHAAVAAACHDLAATIGLDVGTYVERAEEQARCLTAAAHGDPRPLELGCGPRPEVVVPPRGAWTKVVLAEEIWGTRCGDGSPFAFWLRLAPQGHALDRVVVELEGGGACLFEDDCREVARTRPEILRAHDRAEPRGGFMADDPASNPFADWSVRWHALQRWWRGELPPRPPGGGPTFAHVREILRDTTLGLGMTWDGHLVVTTVSGSVVVVDRHFARPPHVVALGETVTNSSAIDEGGGIYVASDRRMHKLVWTGERLSRDERDGAWSAPYDVAGEGLGGIRAGSQGTGSTPTLMGFAADEDRLVVITDGAARMKIVAFWRDAIPPDFVQREGAASRRIADQRVVDFGIPGLAVAQSEQSVAVWGDGALVVNNTGPDTLGSAFENVVAIGVTRPGPRGVAKLVWDAGADRWRDAWARPDVGSPSTVPLVSSGSRQAYVQDARGGRFELIGLDWETGATRTRLVFPRSQAFNGAYTQIQLLPSGDLFMGMLTGPVRTVLEPPPASSPESH